MAHLGPNTDKYLGSEGIEVPVISESNTERNYTMDQLTERCFKTTNGTENPDDAINVKVLQECSDSTLLNISSRHQELSLGTEQGSLIVCSSRPENSRRGNEPNTAIVMSGDPQSSVMASTNSCQTAEESSSFDPCDDTEDQGLIDVGIQHATDDIYEHPDEYQHLSVLGFKDVIDILPDCKEQGMIPASSDPLPNFDMGSQTVDDSLQKTSSTSNFDFHIWANEKKRPTMASMRNRVSQLKRFYKPQFTWSRKPVNWPQDIPFGDPNNGPKGTRPNHNTLTEMYNHMLQIVLTKTQTSSNATVPPNNSVPAEDNSPSTSTFSGSIHVDKQKSTIHTTLLMIQQSVESSKFSIDEKTHEKIQQVLINIEQLKSTANDTKLDTFVEQIYHHLVAAERNHGELNTLLDSFLSDFNYSKLETRKDKSKRQNKVKHIDQDCVTTGAPSKPEDMVEICAGDINIRVKNSLRQELNQNDITSILLNLCEDVNLKLWCNKYRTDACVDTLSQVDGPPHEKVQKLG